MAQFTSYNQVGLKEDVSDIITDITPTDTPLYSTIRSEKANARIVEWMEDSLAAAAANAADGSGAICPATSAIARGFMP